MTTNDPRAVQVLDHNPYDLAPVKEQLEPYRALVDSFRQEAEALDVVDDSAHADAVAMMGQAKKLGKEIDAARLALTEPARTFQSQVNAVAKPFTNPLDTAVKALNVKIVKYMNQQRIEQARREKAAKAEAERMKAALSDDAIEAPSLPALPKVVSTEQGSAHLRTTTAFEIVSPDKVPRKYCSPDRAKIKAAVSAGIARIAGVTITEKTSVVTRTR